MGEAVGSWMLGAVVPGLGAGLLVVGIALAKELVKKVKSDRLRQLLTVLVAAAEQIYGDGAGEVKRAYVETQLQKRGIVEPAREEMEAAVYNLERGM